MNKVMRVFVLAAVVMLASGIFNMASSVMAAEKQEVKAVEAGNKICPVLGNPVSSTATVEYKGKIYHLCCPMCAGTFNQDPEKYSKIADDEVAAQKAK